MGRYFVWDAILSGALLYQNTSASKRMKMFAYDKYNVQIYVCKHELC